MKKLKKILIYVGGGFAGIVALLIVVSMFIDTGSLPMGEKESGPTDPKLEELKKRDAELDKVYEEGDSEFVNPEQDQELYKEKGELSDFDSINESPNRDNAPSGANSANMPTDTPDTDKTAEEPADPDADLVTAIQDDKASTAPDDSNRQGLDQAAASEIRDDMQDEVGSLEDRLDDKMQALEKTVQRLDVSISANDDFVSDLNKIRSNQSAMADQMESTSKAIATLSDRMDKVESDVAESDTQSSGRASRRNVASPGMLRNLYHLKRIEGGTAVLIGQNTGKEYIVAQGDSLAYGGRVAAVRGDHVTLRWPNATSTLSIY